MSRARRRSRRFWLLPVAALVAGSCGDSTGADATGEPAELVVLDGDDQEGTVGEELPEPLVVKVTDERGRALRGQLVNWRVTQGGGSVFAGSSITDSRGEARERWTIGTVAGAPQRVEVRAVDNQSGAALVFATFTARAKAGPVSALAAVTTGTLQGTAGAALSAPIVVRASDQYGNAAVGATVTWEASAGGSASPATSTVDAEGKASTAWTLGTAAGSQQLTARSGTATPVTFTATAMSGGVARLEIVSGDGREGTIRLPLTEPLVVRALDALGNPVAGVPITWSVRSGGGTVSPETSGSNESGLSQTSWTLGTTVGTQTVAASATGVDEVIFTATATSVPTGAVEWSVLAAGGGVSLEKVWAASPTNIVAIGSDNRTVYRFDGTEWRTESIGVPAGSDLVSIWGSSASDIYIVGSTGSTGIVRFDGSTWSQVTGAGYYGRTMVWGRGPNDVYVATNGNTLSNNMFHFDGSIWRDVHIGPYDYTSRPWYCPQAIFVGGSADDVFAADACNGEYVLDESGSGWIRTDIRSMAMWGTSGTGTFGVDGSGVWVRSGSAQSGTFTLISGSPSGTSLWGTSGLDLFVAGSAIHRFDGTTWSEELGGGPYIYVAGFGGAELVAVGSDGRVVRGTR